jgi:predicted transcriptional regulator
MGANVLPAQLEAIEQERSGGPITLHLQLQGLIFRSDANTAAPITDRTEGFWGELAYEVKPGDWVEVLEHWRYAEGFLLQVPVVAGESARAIRASRDIQKAVGDMAEGRYRDAVSACRDALEAAYGTADKEVHPELGYRGDNLREAGKEARFWLLRQALWAITHAAKHRDEATEVIEWERRDAAAVVTILSALMRQDPPV